MKIPLQIRRHRKIYYCLPHSNRTWFIIVRKKGQSPVYRAYLTLQKNSLILKSAKTAAIYEQPILEENDIPDLLSYMLYHMSYKEQG